MIAPSISGLIYLNRLRPVLLFSHYSVSTPHNDVMKRLLQFLQRLMGKPQKISLHTPEELDCFKRDAIENRRKHY